ncbi:MAG: sodium:proton antiporter [Alphaproteobacteria bacterium]|nr:sodium:proton antiporter [Alphaproteobacteria bacterium]
MAAALIVLVFLASFVLLYRGILAEFQILGGGAALVLAIGATSGVYPLGMAFDSIYFETLAMIFGMSALSALLARAGLFAHLAERAARNSGGGARWVLLMMVLVTYAVSLAANSLATMVVLVPITLNLCRRVGLNPVPVIIAEIVAANLGGASTMIGDFPNMILASVGHLHFNDFIAGLMPVCLVLLAALLVFYEVRAGDWHPVSPAVAADVGPLDRAPGDDGLMRAGIMIAVATVSLLVLAGPLDLRPGPIAFLAGLAALVVGRFSEDELLHACGATDVLFFAALFVMVGGLLAAGVLDTTVVWLESVTRGHAGVRAVLLMWLAAATTLFIGAGSSAAVFAPMAASLQLAGDSAAAWWALSLGIMAGSSGALYGATAGSLAMNQYVQFVRRHPETLATVPEGRDFTHREYMRWGMPLMGIFLGVSTVYIAVITP